MGLKLIQSVTANGTNLVTFSSIPQSYRHLYVTGSITTATSGFGEANIRVIANNTTNVSTRYFLQRGTIIEGTGSGFATLAYGGDSTMGASFEFLCMNYTRTDRPKGFFFASSIANTTSPNSRSIIGGGLKGDNSAVSSLFITTAGTGDNNFINCPFKLYGIE